MVVICLECRLFFDLVVGPIWSLSKFFLYRRALSSNSLLIRFILLFPFLSPLSRCDRLHGCHSTELKTQPAAQTIASNGTSTEANSTTTTTTAAAALEALTTPADLGRGDIHLGRAGDDDDDNAGRRDDGAGFCGVSSFHYRHFSNWRNFETIRGLGRNGQYP